MYFIGMTGWFSPLAKIQRKNANLAVHIHKVKFVPRLNDLAVFDTDDQHPGEVDWFICSGKAQTVALMHARHAAPRGDLIAFGHRVLDDDS